MESTAKNQPVIDPSWQKVIMKYNQPDLRKSIWQIINTLLPYLALWYLMIQSLQVSYWITLLLAVIASGFLIRLFIIFHDCGHGSFFKSKRANNIVGMTFGILSFTPYNKWHNQHFEHHATTVNLDKHGLGDVWTISVILVLSFNLKCVNHVNFKQIYVTIPRTNSFNFTS
ncbi:MAG: fatty acid desaturase [Bacteroidota bacterium]|nr:fatty acid desaturase [Bacteroidota bacterium]